jgi:signal transduction histidine kinase
VRGLFQAYDEIVPTLEASDPARARIVAEATQTADLDYLREQVPHAIDQALEGVRRIGQIVKAMREFSHPGSSDRTATDLNRSIETTVTTVTVSRNEWKYVATVELDLASDLPPVPCYADRMNQVLLNLLVNASQAIAATGAGEDGALGRISISTRVDGDAAEIRISDTGCGIPPELQTRIFEPFFTTKEVGKGTGQGLALAFQTVVHAHGGTISVESTVGKGATFILRLPLESALANAA